MVIAAKYLANPATLKESGQSFVLEAVDKTLGRKCIVKILKRTRPEAEDRFRREAKILAGIKHAGVCAIYEFEEISRSEVTPNDVLPTEFGDVFDNEGRALLIVEEAVEGKILSECIESEAFLSTVGIQNARAVLKSAATILRDLLALGVVHHDIKPENIFVMPDWSVRIIDFGIAMLKEGNQITGSHPIGTRDYMAPERLAFQPADEKADMYALGVVAFQMVTKRLPFAANERQDLSTVSAIGSIPASPRAVNRNVPADFEKIILKLLEKSPHDRFQSYEELLGALAGLDSRKRRSAVFYSVLGCALILGISYIALSPGTSESKEVREILNQVDAEKPELAARLLEVSRDKLSASEIRSCEKEIESIVAFLSSDWDKISAGTIAFRKVELARKKLVADLEAVSNVGDFILLLAEARSSLFRSCSRCRTAVQSAGNRLSSNYRKYISDMVAEGQWSQPESSYRPFLQLVDAGFAVRDFDIETGIIRNKFEWAATGSTKTEVETTGEFLFDNPIWYLRGVSIVCSVSPGKNGMCRLVFKGLAASEAITIESGDACKLQVMAWKNPWLGKLSVYTKVGNVAWSAREYDSEFGKSLSINLEQGDIKIESAQYGYQK